MNSTPRKEGTVCFLLKDETVFLILQEYPNGKRVWSGFGGMKEEGETFEECVAREGKEELNFQVDKRTLRKCAVIRESPAFELSVFTANEWEGDPVPSEETIRDAKWFSKEQIPYHAMWQDNKVWMPRILRGEYLTATVQKDIYHTNDFSENDITIMSHSKLP